MRARAADVSKSDKIVRQANQDSLHCIVTLSCVKLPVSYVTVTGEQRWLRKSAVRVRTWSDAALQAAELHR